MDLSNIHYGTKNKLPITHQQRHILQPDTHTHRPTDFLGC